MAKNDGCSMFVFYGLIGLGLFAFLSLLGGAGSCSDNIENGSRSEKRYKIENGHLKRDRAAERQQEQIKEIYRRNAERSREIERKWRDGTLKTDKFGNIIED